MANATSQAIKNLAEAQTNNGQFYKWSYNPITSLLVRFICSKLDKKLKTSNQFFSTLKHIF